MSWRPRKPIVRDGVSADSLSLPLPRARTLFARALRLRCPACGGGPIMLSWFTVAPSCPACGLHLDRDEPGYWIGSYTINLFLTEGFFALVFGAGIWITWARVPWAGRPIVRWGLAALTPVLVVPH